MRVILIALWAGLLLSSPALSQDTPAPTLKLLLTAQRLRRLERDRTRQTVRWVNFENRVNTVPDSPERGFELALYYAVTQDEKRGREAVDWALAHKCDARQVALILDWCGALFSAEQKVQLTPGCTRVVLVGNGLPASLERNLLFAAIARGQDKTPARAAWKRMLPELQNGYISAGDEFYSMIEYLTVVRSAQHVDLRQDDPKLFSSLPVEFLLRLRPAQVKHPDWMTHITALALVALDPNLESSQFLQGWALEEAQMLRDGPGVAYEFLWADPYLPGIGYENLDPWTYDSNGRLFARSSWNLDACWIALSNGPVQQENCPAGWQNAPSVFGHMTLMPMAGHCIELPQRKSHNDSAVLWKLAPHGKVFYLSGEKKEPADADAAGMWRVPENANGHVCTSLDKLKRP